MKNILKHIRSESFKKELEKVGFSTEAIRLIMGSRIGRGIARVVSPKHYKQVEEMVAQDAKALKRLRAKRVALGLPIGSMPKGEEREMLKKRIAEIQVSHPKNKQAIHWKKE